MNKKDKIKLYCCCVAFGIFGSLGFVCLLEFIEIVAIDFRRDMYPYSYPFCIAAGSFSLIVCIAAFVYNVIVLMSMKVKKLVVMSVLKELALSAILLVVGTVMWIGLWNLFSKFLETL